MTLDYTYLNQLTLEDLLDRAQQTDLNNHMVRALVDRLKEYADAYEENDRLKSELRESERRADSWRDEARAIQRQLDQVRT